MLQIQYGSNLISLGLVIVDMQNGFVSKDGSYDKLGMNIENYQQVIPNIKRLISFCRNEKIPIFYTEAIREPSGIDLLLHIHNILPRAREERLQNKKIPICMRDTWDAHIIDEIKPTPERSCHPQATRFSISGYRIKGVAAKYPRKYFNFLWYRYLDLC